MGDVGLPTHPAGNRCDTDTRPMGPACMGELDSQTIANAALSYEQLAEGTGECRILLILTDEIEMFAGIADGMQQRIIQSID